MDKIKVKKEKVIREFREELKLKGIEKREVYDEPFFKILNHVYALQPKEIKCHLTRLNSLTFLVILDHTYIYLEWSKKHINDTLLSITIIEEIDRGGIFTLSLDEALEKIDELCKKKI